MARLRKWGVRVTDTQDRRINGDRPLKVERTFTKIGAEIRGHRLLQAMNQPDRELTFRVETVRITD